MQVKSFGDFLECIGFSILWRDPVQKWQVTTWLKVLGENWGPHDSSLPGSVPEEGKEELRPKTQDPQIPGVDLGRNPRFWASETTPFERTPVHTGSELLRWVGPWVELLQVGVTNYTVVMGLEHEKQRGGSLLLMVQNSGDHQFWRRPHFSKCFLHDRWWSPDFWTISSTNYRWNGMCLPNRRGLVVFFKCGNLDQLAEWVVKIPALFCICCLWSICCISDRIYFFIFFPSLDCNWLAFSGVKFCNCNIGKEPLFCVGLLGSRVIFVTVVNVTQFLINLAANPCLNFMNAIGMRMRFHPEALAHLLPPICPPDHTLGALLPPNVSITPHPAFILWWFLATTHSTYLFLHLYQAIPALQAQQHFLLHLSLPKAHLHLRPHLRSAPALTSFDPTPGTAFNGGQGSRWIPQKIAQRSEISDVWHFRQKRKDEL